MSARSASKSSAFQLRLDQLAELVERPDALQLGAVDEEGRGRVDLQLIAGVLHTELQRVDGGLVADAGVERVVVHSGLLGDPPQLRRGILWHPFVLGGKE